MTLQLSRRCAPSARLVEVTAGDAARHRVLTDEAKQEFAQGWRIVLAGAVALGVGASLYGYVSSLFLHALTGAFGWTRTEMSASIIAITLSTLALPFIGRWIDRAGVARVGAASFLALGLGYLAMTQVSSDVRTFHGLLFMTMLAGGATGPILVSRMVSHWYDKARGLALALTLAGGAIAPILIAPLMSAIMEAFGWRSGFLLLAAFAVTIGAPLAAFAFRDGPSPRSPAEFAGAAAPLTGVSAQQAFMSAKLWLLALCVFLTGVPVIGLTSHLQSFVIERGLDPTIAASFVSVLAAGVLAGRLLTGFLMDRTWAPGVASCVLGVASLGALVLLAGGSNVTLLIVGVALFGVAQGAELDLLAFLTARYFGLRAYATIYGVLMIAFALALPVGAIAFGVLRDRLGAYDAAIATSGAIFAMAAVLFLLMGRYPDFPKEGVSRAT